MSLKERITEDMKNAMRAQDKARVGALRLITAGIKQIEVDQRIAALDDTKVLDVLTRMIKQRRESIDQFKKAGRDDLVAQEQYELEIIQPYLPAALSDGDLARLIEAAIQETGATDIKQMSKVMALLKAKVQGRADMTEVSRVIKQKLAP